MSAPAAVEIVDYLSLTFVMTVSGIRTTPGEILREEFLVPLGISARQLAEALGVPSNRISGIVRGLPTRAA